MKNLSLLIKSHSLKLHSAPLSTFYYPILWGLHSYEWLSPFPNSYFNTISSSFLLKYDLLVIFTTLFLIQEAQTCCGSYLEPPLDGDKDLEEMLHLSPHSSPPPSQLAPQSELWPRAAMIVLFVVLQPNVHVKPMV